ncbi:hypothetical protein [Sphingobium nicotianae]|uniref:Lipoprotein n=1 Tax=Sphingobium nicotianae TaxID=2782607 RepID=A0A9X1DAB5_9SPHN|nr:hypothetical protein [Sphingobium nicotianae]MBT2186276.1 hypothetical protein [Sphingobium nicotianae]
MKRIILPLGLLGLAACTQGAPTEPQLGVREAKDLERLLAGKVAGAPVSCISSYDSSKLQVLGDNILVYRVNKDLLYRNNLQGSCHGLAQGDTLVMNRLDASQYCRGDIAHVVNLTSGSMTGSCALGDFIPYKTAGK